MKKGIVDRFENDWVVIEINGITEDFSVQLIKGIVEVGDVVLIQDDSIISLKDETLALKNDMEKLMNELWED